MENLGLGLEEDTGSPRRWSRGAVSLRNRRGMGPGPHSRVPKGGGSQPGPGFLGSHLDGGEVVVAVVVGGWGGEGGELGVGTPQSLMERAGGLDSGVPGLQTLGGSEILKEGCRIPECKGLGTRCQRPQGGGGSLSGFGSASGGPRVNVWLEGRGRGRDGAAGLCGVKGEPYEWEGVRRRGRLSGLPDGPGSEPGAGDVWEWRGPASRFLWGPGIPGLGPLLPQSPPSSRLPKFHNPKL